MGKSNASDEETVGRSVPSNQAGRRERVTPRQLWASRRSRGKSPGEGLEKFDLPVSPSADVSKQPAPASGARTEGEASGEPVARSEVREAADSRAESSKTADVGEPKEGLAGAVSSAAEAEQKPEQSPARPEPKMVEPSMQPGAMRYPYATYGLPPEPDERKRGGADLGPEQRQFSTSLVLGVLIILVGFLIGLALVGQHRSISSLQRQVTELEEAVSSGFRSGARP